MQYCDSVRLAKGRKYDWRVAECFQDIPNILHNTRKYSNDKGNGLKQVNLVFSGLK